MREELGLKLSHSSPKIRIEDTRYSCPRLSPVEKCVNATEFNSLQSVWIMSSNLCVRHTSCI